MFPKNLRNFCTGVGPVAYVYNASDLHPVEPEKDLNKYVDDTYFFGSLLQLPYRSPGTGTYMWARTNNLMLNTSKSMEMIIHKPRTKLENLLVPPSPE